MTQQGLVLHDFALSGHCHRVRLFLSILEVPYTAKSVDLSGGAHKGAAFVALNPLGQVPVLQDGDTVVADSNAILVYLAHKYEAHTWLPRDPEGAAAVQCWLSRVAGELTRGPALARAIALFGRPGDRERAAGAGAEILAVMDEHLADMRFLAGPTPTIADLAAYAYVARAPEGGVGLDTWSHVRAWLRRVEALPGFVPMPRAPTGATP